MFTHVYDMLNLALIPVFTSEFGLTTIQAGMLSTVFIIASMIGSLSSGFLVDRFGDKPVMMASLVMISASSIIVSRTNSFNMLMADLFLLYFASRLFCPPALSIVSESCDECNVDRGKTVGFHVSIVSLGVALGPIFLGLLMRSYDWRLAYLILAVPILLSMIPIATTRMPTQKQETIEEVTDETPKGRLPDYLTIGFILTLSALGVRSIGLQGVSTFITTYLTAEKGLSSSLSSILFGVSNAIAILGVALGGLMSDKIGEKRWITVAWVGAIISLLAVSLSPSVGLLVVFFIMYSLFNSGSTAPVMSLVARFTSQSKRNKGYTMYFFSSSLMSAFSPLVSARIIDISGIWYIFPFALVMLAIAILLIQKAL
ncbi:MAG: MFS transporter [Candidatus Bathyarchaeota archaeon]|nr:MFS transporter [Candidatus Bathyarchaeota archaeon]